jgi:hypothetical protein
LGNLVEAEAAAREVLRSWQRSLGESHPHTIGMVTTLGVILLAQRRFAEAEPLLRRGVAIRRGPDWSSAQLANSTSSSDGRRPLGRSRSGPA